MDRKQENYLRSAIQEVVNDVLKEEEEKDNKYQEFFHDMLDVFNADDPQDIPKKHRERFFNFVDNGWNSQTDEVDQDAVKNAKEYVKKNMNESTMTFPPALKRRIKQKREQGNLTQKQAIREILNELKQKGKI